jgi:uncharacterized protein
VSSTVSAPESQVARLRQRQITSESALRDVVGQPSKVIREKQTDFLTPLIERYIAASPYFFVATADAAGNCDVSPKGDPAGAVRVIDSRTIAFPDRPGNRRIDGHLNIIENPHVGLIFIIPGVDETLRVNGRAFITDDPELLESMAISGRAPTLVTVVEIDEVFMHCARSILRSGLWKPETWPDPDTIPTLAAIMAEQKHLPPPDESQGKRNEEYRSRLY